MMQYESSFPTKIYSGAGISDKAGEVLLRAGYHQPLLVTDSFLASHEITKKLIAGLNKHAIEPVLFSAVKGNPAKSAVLDGLTYWEQNHCDCIIGFGGGAALDVAKAIAVLANHHEDLFAYEDIPGALEITANVPPVYTIPTTSGTGSETGRSAVIADDITHIKKIIFSPYLMPRAAFLDPLLTLSLPAAMTAATGVDALTHLVEAYLAKGTHPLCDGIALEGIKLVNHSLIDCVRFAASNEGASEKHIQQRSLMQNAAMMGAVAFQKGLGANHSCAHALSTVFDTHHGLANAVMLPFVMDFNRKAVPEKFEELERTLHLIPSKGENFMRWISDLLEKTNLPRSLKEMKLNENNFEQLIQIALKDGCHPSNPVPVSEKDFRKIFKAAFL